MPPMGPPVSNEVPCAPCFADKRKWSGNLLHAPNRGRAGCGLPRHRGRLGGVRGHRLAQRVLPSRSDDRLRRPKHPRAHRRPRGGRPAAGRGRRAGARAGDTFPRTPYLHAPEARRRSTPPLLGRWGVFHDPRESPRLTSLAPRRKIKNPRAKAAKRVGEKHWLCDAAGGPLSTLDELWSRLRKVRTLRYEASSEAGTGWTGVGT